MTGLTKPQCTAHAEKWKGHTDLWINEIKGVLPSVWYQTKMKLKLPNQIPIGLRFIKNIIKYCYKIIYIFSLSKYLNDFEKINILFFFWSFNALIKLSSIFASCSSPNMHTDVAKNEILWPSLLLSNSLKYEKKIYLNNVKDIISITS